MLREVVVCRAALCGLLALVALSSALAPAGAAPPWVIEVVDRGALAGMYRTSIALDTDGSPHVAYMYFQDVDVAAADTGAPAVARREGCGCPLSGPIGLLVTVRVSRSRSRSGWRRRPAYLFFGPRRYYLGRHLGRIHVLCSSGQPALAPPGGAPRLPFGQSTRGRVAGCVPRVRRVDTGACGLTGESATDAWTTPASRTSPSSIAERSAPLRPTQWPAPRSSRKSARTAPDRDDPDGASPMPPKPAISGSPTGAKGSGLRNDSTKTRRDQTAADAPGSSTSSARWRGVAPREGRIRSVVVRSRGRPNLGSRRGWPDLDLDAAGNPHVSYVRALDDTLWEVRYATRAVGTPDPLRSSVGHLAMCPCGQFELPVRVLDAACRPVSGIPVTVVMTSCPDIDLCAENAGDEYLFLPGYCVVVDTTDADGRVSFALRGGGVSSSACATVLAAGQLLAARTIASPDQDGDLRVGAADQVLFAGRMGTTDPRADLNGDGWVNLADLLLFSIHLNAQHTCPSAVSVPRDGRGGPNLALRPPPQTRPARA